ncbi:MAG: histidine phosphatase family protein [Flavobacteriales bacterium]|nr:histidine phosphatase family protein [Flavobacteriales bacterium]
MKQLTIVRHAKSSWDLTEVEDFYRPLSPKGVKNAFAMGDALRDRGIFPDLILTSPAVRAINTAIIIAKKLDFPQQRIESNDRIYQAGTEQLFQVLGNMPESIGHLMLFGHNPSLTNLINRLLPDTLDNLPTCGAYSIGLSGPWAEIRNTQGQVIFSLFPKNMKG